MMKNCTGFVGMEKLFGYSRVSTSDQDWALQVDALTKYGVAARDIYKEKASGTKRDRAELRRVLDLLREGDRLVVYRLDRLARSQLHLLQVLEEIEAKGARLVSINDSLDTSTATGRMLFGVLGVLAQFERDLLVERTKHGLRVAREQRGVRCGRPPKLTPAVIRQVALAHDDPGMTVPEVCRSLGISKSSYYSALRAARLDQMSAA